MAAYTTMHKVEITFEDGRKAVIVIGPEGVAVDGLRNIVAVEYALLANPEENS